MPLVSLHDQLMRPANHINIIRRIELRHHVTAKQESSAARRHPPADRILRIAPQQIAHRSVVRHLLFPIDRPDLVQILNRRTQSAVHAEYLPIDYGRQTQIVKDLGAIAPHIGRTVFPHAFIVEAVDLRDLARFVIAADQRDAIRIADFEGEQQQKRFDAVVTAIDEIAHKQVVGFGDVAADLEQLLQVVELTVDVTADLNRLHSS